MDHYPLPRPEDLFATLEAGACFIKLDLSRAYHQLELDDTSKALTTITTPYGLYQYNRLPFGVAVAPAKFQRVMEEIIGGLSYVKIFLDDLLIVAKDKEESWKRLEIVLAKLQKAGVRLQLSKCCFEMQEYLGLIVSKEGLKTSKNKIKAIIEMEPPQNVGELRTFLGLINYYGRLFVPKLSQEAYPLNELLQKNKKWRWQDREQKAWERLRSLLASAEVLCHFDPKLKIKLDCDASPFGVAAVLSHVFLDGSERPIAYASRSLTQAEKNYSQLDKEALAIIFGIKRFHPYLYGNHFVLVTDHKPLLSILGPKSEVPSLAAARLQRWALILSPFSYEMEFRRTRGSQ